MMKDGIVIYSETGNTQNAAEHIAAGARSAGSIDCRIYNLKEENSLDEGFIHSSSAVIFGTPTYCAGISWQMKKWFDTNWNIKLGGKLGAAFSTENSPHGGGAELAVMEVIRLMLVKGMIVYSGGAEFGHPVIHIGPTIVKDEMEQWAELCSVFGFRVATKAMQLFGSGEGQK